MTSNHPNRIYYYTYLVMIKNKYILQYIKSNKILCCLKHIYFNPFALTNFVYMPKSIAANLLPKQNYVLLLPLSHAVRYLGQLQIANLFDAQLNAFAKIEKETQLADSHFKNPFLNVAYVCRRVCDQNKQINKLFFHSV